MPETKPLERPHWRLSKLSVAFFRSSRADCYNITNYATSSLGIGDPSHWISYEAARLLEAPETNTVTAVSYAFIMAS